MKKILAAAIAAVLLLGTVLPPRAQAQPEERRKCRGAEPLSGLDALLNAMSLEEQAGQLFFIRCPETGAAAEVSAWHPGGLLLFGANTRDRDGETLRQDIASWQAAAERVPLLIGVDEEGGTVTRISSNPQLRSSRFPSPQRVFAAGGMEAVRADAEEKDALLASLGVHVNLAPVADVSTDPGDFIYDRAFGQDAAATAEFVSAVTAQTRADGMGSVLKHFPGYGNNRDTHTGIALDRRPLETFRESDFLPFRAGFSAGGRTTAVLVSHNIMAAVDETLPASLSPGVHGILREELGFDGVVMTDDLAMKAVAAYAGDGSAAVLALKAGNDLIITGDWRNQIPQVLAAVKEGTLTEEEIARACRRVLVWKQALGLIAPTVWPAEGLHRMNAAQSR